MGRETRPARRADESIMKAMAKTLPPAVRGLMSPYPMVPAVMHDQYLGKGEARE